MPTTTHWEPKRALSRSMRLRVGERGGVDRDLLGARVEHLLGVRDRADAAGDAERNIEHARDAPHPGAIDRAALGARGDVVEHQLVGALIAVARGELEDVADHPVVAEAHALDDLAVAHVEAGNYAFGKNGRSSSGVMRSSSNALPLIGRRYADPASAARSAAWRTPPEACQCDPRKAAQRLAVQLEIGSGERAVALDVGAEYVAAGRMRAEGVDRAPTAPRRRPGCQPRVRTRGSPRSSRRTSKARQTRSAPKCSSHAPTSPRLLDRRAADHHARDAVAQQSLDAPRPAHPAADLQAARPAARRAPTMMAAIARARRPARRRDRRRAASSPRARGSARAARAARARSASRRAKSPW